MNVGVLGNPRYEGLPALLKRLADAAPSRGLTLFVEPDLHPLWPGSPATLDLDRAAPDVALCFGGDGTFLRTARRIGERAIPILGINLGRVGFLTTGSADRLEADLDAISGGHYTVEARRVLESVVHDRSRRERVRGVALNDVVVHKAGVARVIRVRVAAGGEDIGAFSADGLVVATPTGSTAYSLSAGGPIVVPGVDALVVTPICPHTLAVRPIIVPGGEVLELEVLPPETDEILVSLDGQVTTDLRAGDRVRVQRAAHGVQLIQIDPKGFFSRMRAKLQWGDLTDRDGP